MNGPLETLILTIVGAAVCTKTCTNLIRCCWQLREDRRKVTLVRTAALETYELLEMVLLELDDMHDLVRARRVCDRWYHLIGRSKGLRMRIFLDAEPVRKRERKMADEYLLPGHFLYNWPPVETIRKDKKMPPSFRIHPALANDFPTSRYGPRWIPLIYKLGEFRHEAMLSWRSSELWQGMFLTQPPVKRLLLCARPSCGTHFVTLYDETGIRLRMLLEWIRDWTDHKMQLHGAKAAWIEDLYRECKAKHEPLGVMCLPGNTGRVSPDGGCQRRVFSD